METIYKIKVRSDHNVSASYPSERRYSASKVLGLTIIYVALASFSLLFTTIMFVIVSHNCAQINSTSAANNVVKEVNPRNVTYALDNLRFVSNVIVASILLFLASLISSITGFMAWKRWYIDTNIKWFFMTSCITILLTSISATLLTWTIIILHYYDYLHEEMSSFMPFYHITINIYIASILAFIWSIISTKISYQGMNSPYQEDYDVNNIQKQNVDWKKINMPPDIINHFSTEQNVIKYLPKKENLDLDADDKVSYYIDTNSESTVCEKIPNKS